MAGRRTPRRPKARTGSRRFSLAEAATWYEGKDFTFDWIVDQDMVIYTVVIAGTWQGAAQSKCDRGAGVVVAPGWLAPPHAASGMAAIPVSTIVRILMFSSCGDPHQRQSAGCN